MPERVSTFDAIVVGGGLGGLSCAALLARQGLRVALLEKNRRLGGYAASYTVKAHRFDIAVQAVGACEPGGVVRRLLHELGLERTIRFLSCEPARVYYFDRRDEIWEQPGRWSELVRGLLRRFPRHSRTIGHCFRTWAGIVAELEALSRRQQPAAFGFARRYPLLARYGDYTVRQFLDELKLPARLEQMLTARSGYCMLPLRELSLVGFAGTETSYRHGAWLIEGGVQRLACALVRALTSAGGRIVRGARAVRLQTGNGRAAGVAVRRGAVYRAPVVVVGTAARPALESWLDRPELLGRRYRRRLSRMRATGSYYVGYYSVRAEAVTGLWPNIEDRGMLTESRGDRHGEVYYILIPSLVDATAAPAGRHCLCISAPLAADAPDHAAARQRQRARLEAAVVQRFPQLDGELVFLFSLGPRQLGAISGNPAGAAYGWAYTPEQSGLRRLSFRTPLPGLYCAGHWTMPGGGIPAVLTSGRICARVILAEA
jgi:prolycopene isomerase